jgi:cytochrome c-type protein NapB
MKKITLSGILLSLAGLGWAGACSGADVSSLRGETGVAGESTQAELKPYVKDQQPIPRDYLQQPPLIPHQIEDYQINIKFNKCLSCHSWANYKQAKATKISQTHFESRDGAILANVSARRYFCTQCHVPQANAQPLVDNTFTPVDALKIR